MHPLRFQAGIKLRGINPYVLVSRARASAIKPGWRKPIPVRVRINGRPSVPWRINLMPVGNGSFYLYLHGDVRKASNTKVGDKVIVEIAFDPAYRSGPRPLPAWFRAALKRNPTARAGWQTLTPSRQKEILRYLTSLKSPAARARNVAKALRVLSGTRERYMARSWRDGA
ncbi:MAG TPA: YdeI/OmpD-associated family protein [Lacunisphaera sp.]|nr:YdeI/OmpD-associated family protein [Lacunisphaera sp.]